MKVVLVRQGIKWVWSSRLKWRWHLSNLPDRGKCVSKSWCRISVISSMKIPWSWIRHDHDKSISYVNNWMLVHFWQMCVFNCVLYSLQSAHTFKMIPIHCDNDWAPASNHFQPSVHPFVKKMKKRPNIPFPELYNSTIVVLLVLLWHY